MFRKLSLTILFTLSTLGIQGAFAESVVVGQRVAVDNYYHGTITAVYSNGTADIQFDSGSFNNWPLYRISAIPAETNTFSVNDRVLADNQYLGTIVRSYPNRTVDIYFDSGSTNNWPISRISRAQNCVGGRCYQ